ncbi:hypothetical protein EO244_15985 [Ancylomarina salipaludis]|uniref:Uncharacterized protein n=1 Tax=Ancylomarina salipaludis TaxID=2501299 RepID=A0A4Q1JIW1_9BACT|nr:hypothetical protein [Ancylomarina salipaludis]RXQ87858.1 hypothetical protein EO244_15985 [Ancylomarina salipaludis]
MKIYSKVNFKNRAERKAFIYGLLIFIIISQVVALIIWFLFDRNNFVELLFALIVAFLVGYRGLKKKS